MQTVLTWGVVLAAFMWRSVSVLALLVWSLLVSYFLGKYFGRLLSNHKEKLWDELWRHKSAREKIDAAYKAKTVDALRYFAESGCEQDYARFYARPIFGGTKWSHSPPRKVGVSSGMNQEFANP
jgi:hypothetical protein